MVIENTRLLFLLYTRPLSAMSEIIDKGNWLYGAVLVTLVAFFFGLTLTNRLYQAYEATPLLLPNMRQAPGRPVALQVRPPAPGDEEDELEAVQAPPRLARRPLPLLGQQGWWFITFRPTGQLFLAFSLAALYVPALILLFVLTERSISFSVAFRRDYGSLLSCTYLAWAASHLPFAILGYFAPTASIALLLWLLSNLYFGFLIFCAMRVACGASVQSAAITAGSAWLSLRFDSIVFSALTLSPLLTLIWLVPLALGALAGMRAAHIQRQSFRRSLQAATLNEHDAEAQYQLGLLYQQRRQHTEALRHFRRAVEIDPKEPDANFQLGIVARQEGRLQDALNHFAPVLAHDDKYRQSEVWREIGATYLAAGMLEEAKSALEKYIERRPFDPEGLFHLAETLSQSGEPTRAQELYRQCIEAVQTMPYYRRHEVTKWSKLAQAKL